MKYHDVLKTQQELKIAIEATKAAEGVHGNINSIVRLMALSSPAAIPNLEGNNKEALAIDVMQSQLNDLRKMMEISMIEGKRFNNKKGSITSVEYERIANKLDKLSNSKFQNTQVAQEEYHRLMIEAEEVMMHCDNEGDNRMFKYLMEKIHRQMREWL